MSAGARKRSSCASAVGTGPALGGGREEGVEIGIAPDGDTPRRATSRRRCAGSRMPPGAPCSLVKPAARAASDGVRTQPARADEQPRARRHERALGGRRQARPTRCRGRRRGAPGRPPLADQRAWQLARREQRRSARRSASRAPPTTSGGRSSRPVEPAPSVLGGDLAGQVVGEQLRKHHTWRARASVGAVVGGELEDRVDRQSLQSGDAVEALARRCGRRSCAVAGGALSSWYETGASTSSPDASSRP